MQNVESGTQSHGEIVVVFIKLIHFVEESDMERTVSLLFDKDKSEVLFTCIDFLSIDDYDKKRKDKLVLIMYVDSLQRHSIHFAMRII